MAETTNSTLKAAAYTAGGTERERVDLPADVFDGTINMPVMHQAVKAYLSNQRLGLAYTKTRGLVTSGTQKTWKQNGMPAKPNNHCGFTIENTPQARL